MTGEGGSSCLARVRRLSEVLGPMGNARPTEVLGNSELPGPLRNLVLIIFEDRAQGAL